MFKRISKEMLTKTATSDDSKVCKVVMVKACVIDLNFINASSHMQLYKLTLVSQVILHCLVLTTRSDSQHAEAE